MSIIELKKKLADQKLTPTSIRVKNNFTGLPIFVILGFKGAADADKARHILDRIEVQSHTLRCYNYLDHPSNTYRRRTIVVSRIH